MPNWVENKICVKGKAKDLLAFINLGIKNSLADEVSAEGDAKEYLESAVKVLKEQGIFYGSAVKVLKEQGIFYGSSGVAFSKEPKSVVSHKGVRFSTFFPIPETYLKYDTTNYKDDFPEAANEQLEKYGAIGWYDYNLKSFGCKWDCPLDNLRLSRNGEDDFVLTFESQTPWSCPEGFLYQITDKFSGLSVYDCFVEEMYESCGYFEVGGKEFDWTHRFCQIAENSGDDYHEEADVLYDEMMYDYDSFVLSGK